MCFGGGGSKETKTESKPAEPTLDPKFNSAQDRTNRLYLAENGQPSMTPILGNSNSAKQPQQRTTLY